MIHCRFTVERKNCASHEKFLFRENNYRSVTLRHYEREIFSLRGDYETEINNNGNYFLHLFQLPTNTIVHIHGRHVKVPTEWRVTDILNNGTCNSDRYIITTDFTFIIVDSGKISVSHWWDQPGF